MLSVSYCPLLCVKADILAKYNSYYTQPEQRQVILNWTRSVPIAGEPADVVAVVENYSKWLTESQTPKLLIHVQPGVLVPPPAVEWLEANVPEGLTVFSLPEHHRRRM